MAERWHFEQDDDEKWTWKRSEVEEQVQSDGSFSECFDCMLDAIRYAVRRRRTLPEEPTND
jgi:hypothetical protein